MNIFHSDIKSLKRRSHRQIQKVISNRDLRISQDDHETSEIRAVMVYKNKTMTGLDIEKREGFLARVALSSGWQSFTVNAPNRIH